MQQGWHAPAKPWLFQNLRKTHLKFRSFLGGIWPKVMSTLLFFWKNWHLKIFLVWPNSHFCPRSLTSASIWKKGQIFAKFSGMKIDSSYIKESKNMCLLFEHSPLELKIFQERGAELSNLRTCTFQKCLNLSQCVIMDFNSSLRSMNGLKVTTKWCKNSSEPHIMTSNI